MNGLHAVFVTHTAPVPLVSGERIRTFNLAKQLARQGWRVSIFSLVPGEEPDGDAVELLQEIGADVRLVRFGPVRGLREARILRDLVTKRAVHRDLFVDARSVAEFRGWLAGRHADVLVASLYMFPYIPAPMYSRLVLDSHNAEARRIEAMASTGKGARAWAARLQIEPVRRYELDAARLSRRVIAVSEVERTYYEAAVPGKVDLVPNGVDCSAYVPRTGVSKSSSLLFLGSMDYSANVDGVVHLVRDVLPRVRARGVKLVVAGSNPRRTVYAAARRAPGHVEVEVVGYVRDPDPYFASCRAFVVPLRYGGGTRIKILEALARGVPVVSTAAGCEGLDLEDGTELMVRDEPGEFAAAIDRLLVDDELCARLAKAGRQAVVDRYDWKAIGSLFTASLCAAV
jgi:glycosyltransferase involved in cell wall biosynthesis